ncbi:unnamed protein product [Ectocarpus sp. CCAP 1310/34]|nr:unnamed protein product [Ectocarpus sp. CCAP 1310/34]
MQCRQMYEAYTDMWMAYNMAFIYTMASLITDDVATSLARRDVTNLFSPQDCINFLRFTQPQVGAPQLSRVHLLASTLLALL